MFKENCLNLLCLVIWVKFSYKKWDHTGPRFFCHRENFFFCRPAQQVIFLCTSKHNHTANFKKFLNTGQGDGQRGWSIRYNHFYLKNHAWKLNFKHTCLRKLFKFAYVSHRQFFTNFLFFEILIF